MTAHNVETERSRAVREAQARQRAASRNRPPLQFCRSTLFWEIAIPQWCRPHWTPLWSYAARREFWFDISSARQAFWLRITGQTFRPSDYLTWSWPAIRSAWGAEDRSAGFHPISRDSGLFLDNPSPCSG